MSFSMTFELDDAEDAKTLALLYQVVRARTREDMIGAGEVDFELTWLLAKSFRLLYSDTNQQQDWLKKQIEWISDIFADDLGYDKAG